MSRTPARLAGRALALYHLPSPYLCPRCRFSTTTRWHAQDGRPSATGNPILDAYRQRHPQHQARQTPSDYGTPGDLAPSSIFEQHRTTGKKEQPPAERRRDPSNMAPVLDPDPRSRRRWERKMVIRAIHKRGRVSRTTALKRSEREILSKSHFLKTSVKKLGPLARQMAGKTLADAMLQMRFSKKKAAKEVLAHLEYARDEAIVKRGMGLGKSQRQHEAGDTGREPIKPEPVEIRLKDGKKRVVQDPTEIYIDQAWVGRGPYGIDHDYRAMGRVFRLRPPFTSISVLLKEQATRIREHKDRQERLAKRQVWVQLPDRPITAQRQYFSW